LQLGVGRELAHSDVALTAAGAVVDLADQLTTGGVDVFATGFYQVKLALLLSTTTLD